MNLPRNVQTTSTDQKLNERPGDMPKAGGRAPQAQTSSNQIPLNRTPHPVAAFGAKPSMGTVQCDSTQATLSRNATSPYEKLSALKPQTPFGGKGKRGK